jgi:hypothetical protein
MGARKNCSIHTHTHTHTNTHTHTHTQTHIHRHTSQKCMTSLMSTRAWSFVTMFLVMPEYFLKICLILAWECLECVSFDFGLRGGGERIRG